MKLDKSHIIQLITTFLVLIGLIGGSIGAYYSVIGSIATAQARTDQHVVDLNSTMEHNFVETNGRLRDVQNDINSINEYLRPTKRGDR